MLICILNTPLFPCPRTHLLHVRKLAEGFIQRGYHFKELKSAREILNLSDADILYVSNHFSCDRVHRLFRAILAERLLALLRCCDAKLILWSFHTVRSGSSLRLALSEFSNRTVHLGEECDKETLEREPELLRFREENSVVALMYSSPLHPDYVRASSVARSYDFNFVGHGYKREWTSHCALKYNAFIRNTPPTISEAERVNSFRRANVNLVFHSEANIRKDIIVERFAEALSLGGIIFHDHPGITRRFATVRSLMLVKSTDDIDREYAAILRMSDAERDELRRDSIKTWKESGRSYFHQAGRILQHFEKIK